MTLGYMREQEKTISTDRQCSSGGFCSYADENGGIFTCIGCNGKASRDIFTYVSENEIKASRDKQINL